MALPEPSPARSTHSNVGTRKTLTWERPFRPPPLMFEFSAQYKNRCFHAFPSPEANKPNTQKPRRAYHERSAPLSPWECRKFCLWLTRPAGLSKISLQVFCHSLPLPRPRSSRPSSYPRWPKANSAHFPALSYDGSGLTPSCWISMKISQ